MFGCCATSTIRGVRIHCEQSSVGNVSDSWDICPPIDGSCSTITTFCPAFAISSAAWIPAMPPPMTSAVFVTGTLIENSGLFRFTFSTIIETRSVAFSVVASPLACTHEQCSRRFAISQRNGFNPVSAHVLRNVGSCMRGEHAATTTPVRFFSLIAWRMRFCPGSEHMYL